MTKRKNGKGTCKVMGGVERGGGVERRKGDMGKREERERGF